MERRVIGSKRSPTLKMSTGRNGSTVWLDVILQLNTHWHERDAVCADLCSHGHKAKPPIRWHGVHARVHNELTNAKNVKRVIARLAPQGTGDALALMLGGDEQVKEMSLIAYGNEANYVPFSLGNQVRIAGQLLVLPFSLF